LGLIAPFCDHEIDFHQILDAIEQGNFQPITFKQLQESSREPKTKEIIIGFDDCGRHLLILPFQSSYEEA